MTTARNPERARLRVLACVAAVALSVGALEAKDYTTPGFRSKQSRPMTLALLPPHAEFIKAKAVMTDQMVKESQALEDEAALALKTELEQKGYSVRVLAPRDLEQDPELALAVRGVNDRYNEEWSKLLRKPRRVKQRRYTAGESAARLCSLLKVDGLAVARIQAVGVTGGRATLVAVMSLGNAFATSYARLDLGVIEGKQGTIEGYFTGMQNCRLKSLTDKPQMVMRKVAENALHWYPKSDEVKEVKQSEVAEAAGGEEPAVEEDEAAIKDFEMLLGGPQPAAGEEAAEQKPGEPKAEDKPADQEAGEQKPAENPEPAPQPPR